MQFLDSEKLDLDLKDEIKIILCALKAWAKFTSIFLEFKIKTKFDRNIEIIMRSNACPFYK